MLNRELRRNANGLGWYGLCVLLVVTACRSDPMPDSQPVLADVVGRWHGVIDPGSLTWGEAPKFAKARPMVELRADRTFTVVDLPWDQRIDTYPIPGKRRRPIPPFISESGTWFIDNTFEEACDLVLTFTDSSGKAVCDWQNSFRVIGRKPPYRLSYTWRDPDERAPVYFEREPVAASQSVASPSTAAAS